MAGFVDSPSKRLFALAVSFSAGIALHAFDERVWGLLPAFVLAAAGMAAAFIDRGPPLRRFVWSCLAAALIGIGRYDLALAALPPLPAASNGIVSLSATVIRTRQGQKNAILVGDRVVFSGTALAGRIEITSALSAGARAGDEIEARCRLAEIDPASPKRFLERVVGRCFPRDPIVILRRPPHRDPIDAIQEHTRRVAGQSVPEPEASLLLGMTTGDRSGLPADLNDDFRAAGVSHIMAVSGYNVTKIADLALALLALSGMRHRRAAAATIVVLFVFAAVAGLGAPVVRAAAMGSLSLVAALLRRVANAANALVLAAALMLAQQPFLLRHDLPFALSFAAIWGLSALARPFEREWAFLPEVWGIRKTLAETVGATLATLPLLLMTFGTLPLISPFTNMLVLPLVPAVMALGLAVIVAGSMHPLLAAPAALAAAIIIRIMETVVSAFAALPWNPSLHIGPAGAVVIAGWIVLLAYALRKKGEKTVEPV
ncbi:ComEC/Rec2 family competence protein [Candidatus Uhrbacteria bacterium]|nr:ComEC/Rec2 family competence protein [Candidatus Uhrbacteria bacterium]